MVRRGRRKREDSPYTEQSRRLSAWLRSLRDGRGLSQDELARRASVPVATLRAIEAGAVVNPGYFTIMALLNILGVQPEDMATNADPAAPTDKRLRRRGTPRSSSTPTR